MAAQTIQFDKRKWLQPIIEKDEKFVLARCPECGEEIVKRRHKDILAFHEPVKCCGKILLV